MGQLCGSSRKPEKKGARPFADIRFGSRNKGMVIASHYGIYKRTYRLDCKGKWSIITTIFSRALIAEEPIFSRLTNIQKSNRGSLVRPRNAGVRKTRKTCWHSLFLPNQRSAPAKKEIPASGIFPLARPKRARGTRFCSTPSLLIWQYYNFSNVDMRIDRSAKFPTRTG
jgi:hypothetical protein